MLTRVAVVLACAAALGGLGYLAYEVRSLKGEVAALRADVSARRAHDDGDSPGLGPAQMFAAIAQSHPAFDSTSIQAIADAVAATLAKRAGPVASAGTAPVAPSTPAPASPEQELAISRAEQAVSGILRQGHISRDDVVSLRRELADVGSSDEVDALRARIAQAVNRNELSVDDPRFVIP
jgi:hypothetical protein